MASQTGLIAEFKTFALKGNMVDLAVGLVVGVAFGAVVTSLVTDVISPPLGYIMGGLDFSDKHITMLAKGSAHPITGKVFDKDLVITYGKLINAMINFIVQAMAIFLVVKVINSMRRKEEIAPSAPPAPTKEESLLTEIRDLLKAKA